MFKYKLSQGMVTVVNVDFLTVTTIFLCLARCEVSKYCDIGHFKHEIICISQTLEIHRSLGSCLHSKSG